MSPIARRRIAALLLLAGIVAAVLALTDQGPFEAPPATTEDRVEARVERLFAAAAAGDFATFCGLLTDRARETLRRRAARLGGGGEPPPCARTLALTLGDALEGSTLGVREVSVSGPHARVTARLHPSGEEPELRTIYLDEIDDEWLVSDPG